MVEVDKRVVVEIAKKHDLALVVLFGSQATGHTHKKSDVDVGYLSERDIDYRESYEITLAFGRIFKHADVELVNLLKVSPELKKQVADQGNVLFEEYTGAFDLFSIHANRTYLDTKPLRLYKESYVKDFLQSYA